MSNLIESEQLKDLKDAHACLRTHLGDEKNACPSRVSPIDSLRTTCSNGLQRLSPKLSLLHCNVLTSTANLSQEPRTLEPSSLPAHRGPGCCIHTSPCNQDQRHLHRRTCGLLYGPTLSVHTTTSSFALYVCESLPAHTAHGFVATKSAATQARPATITQTGSALPA